IFDLGTAYQNGAVLVFHFYHSLIGYEQVGINIEDFIDQMLATTNWTKEAGRPAEFQPVMDRVTAARARAPRRDTAETAVKPEEVSPDINNRIIQSDELIRERKYEEARPILEQVLSSHPNNARALYGMAEVVNQTPSKEELDANADENDKIEGQHRRLELAIKLYRKAIESANSVEEAWMIQWSHVLVGRILDFQEFRKDAIDEYEKAIAMGAIPSGAYKEAVEGKDHPFGQKH
ncbi:MAG: tetratricopeptide repeat protein, partial [Blastocatellia bacterium]